MKIWKYICNTSHFYQKGLIAVVTGLFCVQIFNWINLTPLKDEYSMECYIAHTALTAKSKVLAKLPEDRVILVGGDNYSFALITGRSTMSLTPSEWRQSDPRKFLKAKGICTQINTMTKSDNTIEVHVKTRNLPDGQPDFSSNLTEGVSMYGVHRRWMNMTRTQANRLWKTSFPNP